MLLIHSSEALLAESAQRANKKGCQMSLVAWELAPSCCGSRLLPSFFATRSRWSNRQLSVTLACINGWCQDAYRSARVSDTVQPRCACFISAHRPGEQALKNSPLPKSFLGPDGGIDTSSSLTTQSEECAGFALALAVHMPASSVAVVRSGIH